MLIGSWQMHVYVPISNDESPRLMTLGSEAMIRLWWGVEELDTPCREVSVLTGGRAPPPETYNTQRNKLTHSEPNRGLSPSI